ncbi:hypothetical protein ACHAWU_001579 [Discostella pseudostelligera]|uniref:Uncharacterized protein n=1 Tax=Discostella pseudostelligera TaxID=259834 RepID=A0ABD3MGX7_9STRA
MSAYASLPGSFLPPFFSFGASSTSSNSSNTNTLDKKDGTEQSKCTADTSSSVPPNTLDSLSAFDPNFDSKKCTTQSKDTDVPSESEVAAAAALPSASTSSSRPSDIIIAIRSARVDPVALIKSLTSTGSNIARRTASFIVRTPEVDNCSAAKLESSIASMDEVGGGGDGHADNEGGSSDRSSVISRPGLCYEDSDSDEEFSMYDYSDDFSSPNDDNKIDSGLHHEEEHLATSSDGNDPSAIEFELSITFQGRKYNATRGFPTFVKLREDLLHELKNNDRRSRRFMGGTKSPVDGMDVDSTKKKVDAFQNKDCNKLSITESLSVPELPRVSPESLGHGGYALCGVARSGFALLQATAQHYCPEMERWMRHVIEAFPCSQSLSSFLWEPLSSSNASWETIGEGKQSTSCNDMGHNVKLGSLDSPCSSDSLWGQLKMNVKAEIENLIHEKQLLEDSLASNERTSQLETERDWYKKEALHLDEVLEQSKVQQKKLTDQLFEREQDAKLMKRQVEKLMKRSRILEMKLKELGVEVTTLSEDGIYVGAEIEEADDDVERKADDIPTK